MATRRKNSRDATDRLLDRMCVAMEGLKAKRHFGRATHWFMLHDVAKQLGMDPKPCAR